MRYRHDGVLADVFPPESNDPADAARVRVEFVDEWSAVSPGQAAVFYAPEREADGAREVLGGGIIAR
jgi:tRNA U34 2-thiouridine synthase MnmA/TrmU